MAYILDGARRPGSGAVSGIGVTGAENIGSDVLHQTVITLKNTPVPVASVADAAGVGGAKVFDFPEGRILFLGATAKLTIAVPADKQADFTDATPEGDIGIGTAVPADADALGTDATDDDLATATAFTMAAFSATANLPSEAVAQFDGTSSPKAAFVNVLIDAGDIDDDASTHVLVSGTVTLTWINQGDY